MAPPVSFMAEVVYLTRHGVTEANLRRVRAGLTDIPLVDAGRAQAAQLADRLRSSGIGSVWSSPLRRAVETARILADELRVPLHEDPGLIEIDVGPWEGLGEDDVARHFAAEYDVWRTRPTQLVLPGHESLESVQQRAVPVIDRLFSLAAPPLCVSHLGVLRVLLLHYTQRPLDQYGSISIGHCELMSIERVDDRFRVTTS